MTHSWTTVNGWLTYCRRCRVARLRNRESEKLCRRACDPERHKVKESRTNWDKVKVKEWV